MAPAEQVFVCNFGSSRATYSNLVSVPTDIEISDTHGVSILRFDVILDEKSNMVAHSC